MRKVEGPADQARLRAACTLMEERGGHRTLREQVLQQHRRRRQTVAQHVPTTMREHDEVPARQRDRRTLPFEPKPGLPLLQDMEVRQAACWQRYGPGGGQLRATEDL